MSQEKKLALLVTIVFGLGILSGLVIGSMRSEDREGNTIVCPIDSISAVLLRDNL